MKFKSPPLFRWSEGSSPERMRLFKEESDKTLIEFLWQSFQIQPDWVIHAKYIEDGDKDSSVEIEIDSRGHENQSLEKCWERWKAACEDAFKGQAVDEEDGDFNGITKNTFKGFLVDYVCIAPPTVEETIAALEAEALKSKHKKVITLKRHSLGSAL